MFFSKWDVIVVVFALGQDISIKRCAKHCKQNVISCLLTSKLYHLVAFAMARNLLPLVTLVATQVNYWSKPHHVRTRDAWTKCLPIVAMMAFVVIQVGLKSNGSIHPKRIAVGLFFCMIGDAFLTVKDQNYFLAGMVPSVSDICATSWPFKDAGAKARLWPVSSSRSFSSATTLRSSSPAWRKTLRTW